MTTRSSIRHVHRSAANAQRIWILLIALSVACSGPTGSAQENPAPRDDGTPASTETKNEGPKQLSSFDSEIALDREWTGDLDGMVERLSIRALVAYSKTFYFLDGATQRGISYEALKEFETFLNKRLGRRTLQVSVVIIPVQRDELLPALAQGLGDLAAANLTITPERLEKVAFSEPFATGVDEVIVTGPMAPDIETLDDLAGRELHVRRSSSYWESVNQLNQTLAKKGMEPVRLIAADEFLEDEDLLEMVNAGLIPTIIVDSHKAAFWTQIFDHIVVHKDLAVRTGGRIGWAFRQDSPQLAEVVNAFVKQSKKGTLLGNVVLNRYLRDNTWVRNPLVEADRKRFENTLDLFKKYGEQFEFDFLMLTALAYQESRLDQSVRSNVGAVGVMQLLPSTAADPNVSIPNIDEIENNIHAGAKYLRFLRDRYFSDPEMDQNNQTLFSFAAYNAGPAKVRRLREEAQQEGLDPNVWFLNVERIAAKRIGRETVQYVSNIAKYYIAYRQVVRQVEKKQGRTTPPG
jgi:membrane-bound lytic murein transglycosylase MltF